MIDASDIICDSPFEYFLYGTDVISHPNFSDICTYISHKHRDYKIQIPLESPYNKLQEKVENYKSSNFVISKKIQSKQDLSRFFTSIKSYHKSDIIMNYDLLIKKEYIPLIEKILQRSFSINSDMTYKLQIGNIYINLRELYFINPIDKKIDNLTINKCFSQSSFSIEKDHIKIYDHLEVTKDLKLTFHNPLCFIGQHMISSLTRTHSQIISDFERYKIFLPKANSDFSKDCFSCIKNKFHY